MLEVVRRVPIPTLCAVNGYCLGGAMELAMVCDVRVASENAVFGMPEIKVGIPSVLDAALLQQHGLEQGEGDAADRRPVRNCGDGSARIPQQGGRAGPAGRGGRPHARPPDSPPRTALAAQKRLFETWQNASLEGAIGASVDEFARVFESEETLRTIAEYATRLREKKS